MAEVRLEKVCKAFGPVEVLHDVDLHIRDGEFVVFVGPSGCGKSTLLRLIAGLEQVTAGDVRMDGRIVNALTPAERRIAMVFQSYALYPHMSVRKNLSFGLENLHMKRAEIDRKVADAARMLDIEPYLDRRPRALSGGQRQRVAIGRAIVRDPAVFLFDEPLSNLDAKLRVQTRAEISNLHRQLGTTMIYVTHDQVEAMTMAQRIVVLRDGVVEQFGRPLELFERPANRFVAEFIGSPRMNILPARIASIHENGIRVEVEGVGPCDLPFDGSGCAPGAAVALGIRPSHLRLDDRSAAPGARLSVVHSESMGSETFVYGKIDGVEGTIILHVADHLETHAGDVLPLTLPASHCHLFRADTNEALPRLDACQTTTEEERCCRT